MGALNIVSISARGGFCLIKGSSRNTVFHGLITIIKNNVLGINRFDVSSQGTEILHLTHTNHCIDELEQGIFTLHMRGKNAQIVV